MKLFSDVLFHISIFLEQKDQLSSAITCKTWNTVFRSLIVPTTLDFIVLKEQQRFTQALYVAKTSIYSGNLLVNLREILPDVIRIACKIGDSELLTYMLDKKLLTDCKFAFDLSVRYGRLEFIKVLLGRRYLMIDDVKHAAFLAACRFGDAELVRFLAGRVSQKLCRQGLGEAVKYGNLDIIKKLMPFVSLKMGRNRVLFALRKNYLNVAQFLIGIGKVNMKNEPSYSRNYQSRLNSSFLEVCKNGFVKAAEMMLSFGIDQAVREKQAFYIACVNDNREIATMLVSKRAVSAEIVVENLQKLNHQKNFVISVIEAAKDYLTRQQLDSIRGFGMPDIRGLYCKMNQESPFVGACKNANVKLVNELLSKGVDPAGGRNNEALIAACSDRKRTKAEERAEIVKMLLETKRVNPAAHDHAALMNAAQYGFVKCVKLLLDFDPSNEELPTRTFVKAVVNW